MYVKTSLISKKFLALLMMAGALSLTACSDSSDDSAEQTAAPQESTQMTNTMDVKQPEPTAETKAPLAEESDMPKVVEEAKEAVEQEVAAQVEKASEQVKEVVNAPAPEPAAVSGDKVYATCVGCHGAQGEGGVGPKLAGQAVDAVVDKLQRYKAGEQIGPLTGMMAPMASGLSDADMQAVAEYVNQL
ncbi:c-type cytochrome [Thiomicrorhabdus xiamenensis]|nr:c-type cytochrome [Thiomicrorhabdus xiamenensis]